MNQNALVTGASGFIGSHLVRHLQRTGWRVGTVRARLREGSEATPEPADVAGRVVFHLGGIAHRQARIQDQMAANRDLTDGLYDWAAKADAQGFVFVSTSKVLGDSSTAPLGPHAPRRPQGAYAESKAAAETALLAAHRRHGLPLAIVRPPLVYGPGVKANLGLLLRALAHGIPLPLASATAPRSYVSVAGLTSALAAIGAALRHRADPEIWHVTDGNDVSTAALCRTLAGHLGRNARLFPMPRRTFAAASRCSDGLGLSRGLVASLFDPFRLDDSALLERLRWRPGESQDAALKATAQWFRRTQGKEHPGKGV